MNNGYDPQIMATGDGPPLVLVPGLDGTGQLFYLQVPLLARRYKVVTYALRERAGAMQVLVDDLARVVASASEAEEPAIVIGESFGGALALSFALAYPRRVASLVVLNSFPCFLPQARLQLAIHGVRLLPWGAMGLVRRLTAFRMHSRFTHREEIERFLELTRQTTKPGYLDRLGILADYDIRERLQEIEAPTLFLAADEDHLVPSVEQAEYMAARVPDADVEVLEGHGHVCLIAPNLDLEDILASWGSAGTTSESGAQLNAARAAS